MSGPRNTGAATYPVEDFLQALTAQLDRAQDALAVKVTGTNRPLTWALKDISIDLRVFIDVNQAGRVTMRSAAANEDGASTVHLSLTTITRPMVEENAVSFHEDIDPRPVEDLASISSLDAEGQRKLDWLGIRTVGQLKRLDPELATSVVGLPIGQLQAALAAAARPTVRGTEVVARAEGSLLRIRGANLTDVVTPEVRLRGQPVEVVEHGPTQILVRPLAEHLDAEGQVEVLVNNQRATGYFRMGGRGYGGQAAGTPTATPTPTPTPTGTGMNGTAGNGAHE
jgi:hypothetical protein